MLRKYRSPAERWAKPKPTPAPPAPAVPGTPLSDAAQLTHQTHQRNRTMKHTNTAADNATLNPTGAEAGTVGTAAEPSRVQVLDSEIGSLNERLEALKAERKQAKKDARVPRSRRFKITVAALGTAAAAGAGFLAWKLLGAAAETVVEG